MEIEKTNRKSLFPLSKSLIEYLMVDFLVLLFDKILRVTPEILPADKKENDYICVESWLNSIFPGTFAVVIF